MKTPKKSVQYTCIVLFSSTFMSSVNGYSDDLISIVQNVDETTKVSYSVDPLSEVEVDLFNLKDKQFDETWQERVLGVLVQRFIMEKLPELNEQGITLQHFDTGTFSVDVDLTKPYIIQATVYDTSGGEVTALSIPLLE